MSYPPFQSGYPQQPPQQPGAYGGSMPGYPAGPGYPDPFSQPGSGQVIGFSQPGMPQPQPTPGYPQQPPSSGYGFGAPPAQQQQWPQPQPGYPAPNYPQPGQQQQPAYPAPAMPQYGGQAYPPAQTYPTNQYQQQQQPAAAPGAFYPPQASGPAPGSLYPQQMAPVQTQPMQTLSHGTSHGMQPAFGTGSGFGASGDNQYSGGRSSPYSQTQSPPAQMQFEGTVKPFANFSPNTDAEMLRKAMKGLGCDDKAVMNILCYRSNAQRQQIRTAFKTMYGKDLIKELVDELRGNFEDLIVALMFTPAEYDCRELDYAMRGIGTTETTLIEIMTTRTNAEIQAIKQCYKTCYGKDLETALKGETSGYFRRMLVCLSVGGRDESNSVDRARAAEQARGLQAAGVGRWGTDEAAFLAVLVASSPPQLQAVFDEYRRLAGHDVEQAVRQEFSGDILDGMLALVKSGKNRPAFFAERLNIAMKGMGTNDRDLIRVIVSRCEKDTVQIKQAYQQMYNVSLGAAIKGDTSGKYKEGLLALIGG